MALLTLMAYNSTMIQPRSDLMSLWDPNRKSYLENKKHLKNVGPIRYCEPPLHCQSPGLASHTPAIAIARAACDVHDNNNNNDNA